MVALATGGSQIVHRSSPILLHLRRSPSTSSLALDRTVAERASSSLSRHSNPYLRTQYSHSHAAHPHTANIHPLLGHFLVYHPRRYGGCCGLHYTGRTNVGSLPFSSYELILTFELYLGLDGLSLAISRVTSPIWCTLPTLLSSSSRRGPDRG